MLRTQNNATNSYYFNTAVNNNNKTNSYLAIPFYDYHMMTIILRVCRFFNVWKMDKSDERIRLY